MIMAAMLLMPGAMMAQERSAPAKERPAPTREGVAPTRETPTAAPDDQRNAERERSQNERERSGRKPPKVDMNALAQARAQAYVDALQLDREQSAKLLTVFQQAERKLLEQRQRIAEMRSVVAEEMAKAETEAEVLLTEDQRAQLGRMRMEGTFDTSSIDCPNTCCSPGKNDKARERGVRGETLREKEAPKPGAAIARPSQSVR